MRVDSALQTLFIEEVSDRDRLFRCSYYDYYHISVTIRVDVIDPLKPMEATVNTSLPHHITITYGQPLRLNCRNALAHPNVTFSWINWSPKFFREEEASKDSFLELMPDEMFDGPCRCLARTASGQLVQRTVVLTVLDTPPVFLFPNAENTITLRDRRVTFTVHFRFRLDRSNVSVVWKTVKQGNLVDHDFGPRLNFGVHRGTYLVFSIHNALLSDSGWYFVNVSNQHGYTELKIRIVIPESSPRDSRDVQAVEISSRLDGK